MPQRVAHDVYLIPLSLRLFMTVPGTRDRLPIIDVAPLLDSDPKNTEIRDKTARALHSACIEYGFFYLNIQAYVDPSEPEELLLLGKQFLSLPQAEKDQLSLKNQDYARGTYPCKFKYELLERLSTGYAKLKENVTNGKADNHEGLDFYKPVENPDKTKPIWGENQWPSIPGFKDKFEQWVEKMKALGLILMEA